MPAGVGGDRWIDAEWHEPEVRGRDLPLDRVAPGIAVRRDLFEMRDLAEVDLRREVAPDRRLERLIVGEHPAGERPGTRERGEGPLPEQCLKHAVPDLEHSGQGDL